VKRIEPKEFWAFIEETNECVEKWVRENKSDINYECCGYACNILYRILVDWKINERCGINDVDEVIRIAAVSIRDIGHFVVTILNNWFFDPTYMQFGSRPSIEEYSMGWLYDDCYEECKVVLEDNSILELCKEIRPEVYING